MRPTFRRPFVAVAVVFSVLALQLPASAGWTQRDDEWGTFRRDNTHSGAAAGSSAFTAGAGGFARVKWRNDNVTYPILGSPAVGDLERDGTKEVVVNETDVKTQVGPPPQISFNHRVEAFSSTGSIKWGQEETNSFTLAQPPSVLDIDNDAQAEVLHFAGNPVAGTSQTNKLVARSHTGAELWRFSSNQWGLVQAPIGVVTGIHAANVDNEATQNEVVAGVSLATWTIDTGPAGPDCPDPNAQKILLKASMLKYFVHAINGEGSPTDSWRFAADPGIIGSTPLIAELNGDGKNDVVWGSGSPAGPVLPSCSAEVSLDDSAIDNRIIAIDGANPPNTLWTKNLFDPAGVKRPVPATPVLAGTTSGGDPILVFLIPVPKFEPAANDPDRNVLMAINGRTGDTLWQRTIRPATIAPLAAANIVGDSAPEIVVQTDNRLELWSNSGTQIWSQSYDRLLTSAGPAVADLDGDGTKEIATILNGGRAATDPKSQLLVVDGATGAQEWTFDLVQDTTLGGPVIADVDNDDDNLEIVVAAGSPTAAEAQAHKGSIIVLEPNAPDLTVTNVQVIGNAVAGEPQTVRVTVRNDGQRDAPSSVVRVKDGAATVGEQGAAVAVGATTTVDIPWTPATSGNHTLTATADANGTVREGVETNNAGSTTLRIKARPVAAFTFSPTSPKETDTVQFTDQSTDADGTISSRSWSCTDGFASSATNPSHRFVDGNSYSCTLSVTDNDGLSASTTKSVPVAHVAPVANFITSVSEPGKVQFTDTSSHPNSPTDDPPTGWTYGWDFESDGTVDSSARSPFHDYGTTSGQFAVKLAVTDNDGQTNEITKVVDVAREIGTVALSPSAGSGTIGSPYTLAATVTDTRGDPVANATVGFEVTSGPHAGTAGSGTTDTTGRAPFTYTGTKVGDDTVRATAGSKSGTATVRWLAPPAPDDYDRDGLRNTSDNCWNEFNPDQADNDRDGIGNACDNDDDNDSLLDTEEAPNGCNAFVADTDGEGLNDWQEVKGFKTNCNDTDTDDDGLNDKRETEIGTKPLDPDTDHDGVKDGSDNCPTLSNPDQRDSDGDGKGDVCDGIQICIPACAMPAWEPDLRGWH